MNEGEILAGRYVLGSLLGSGGMGRVYAAQDRKLARDVALKILSAARPEPEVLRRFEREAMAAGSLQHPNVVAVFDVGEEHGRPFLVTELLKGQDLRATLAHGALPEHDALRIARQIAAGLAAAHEKGLTHRDLKPENVFITNDGWVKILDFGLVKLTEGLEQPRPADDASTGAGRVLGTVGYMAPEQVRGRPVDPRADLFNLGLVLYEMLSGNRAFRAGSPTETGYATLMREPEPLPRTVHPKTRALVAACLKKDPIDRIGSARELLSALDEASRAANVQPSPLPGRALVATGIVLAIAGAAAAAYGLRHVRATPAPVASAAQAPSGTVAILPFGARDAPDFGWLSEGVVDLLARDLEGSDLRAVDSASVLRAVGADNPADIDKVRGASAQLGAKYFVLGRIEERRGQLVLEAVLHTGDAGVPVAEAVAQGAPGDLLQIICKLSDQLQVKTRS
ncbi:MAG TPA: serine/threonine-protein kinase, partial [Myxococcales bacterium]|nr:serine/threonine-protein kinase [Myxococcales bacterium]